MFIEDNKHIEGETLGGIYPDPNRYTILSEERLTQFRFDKIYEIESEEPDSSLEK